MVVYSCKYCNFSTELIGNYKKHLKTKKHGRNINPDYKIENEIGVTNQKEPKKNQKEPQKNQKEPQKNQQNQILKNYSCNYCEDTFKTFSSKRRHEIHRCVKNPYNDKKIINKEIKKIEKEKENLQKDKKKLENDKKKLEKKVDKLTDRIGNTTNIQTNHTNNNIKINSYGQEDVSHITEAFKTSLLSGPYGAIPKLIEAIHFNDTKPENKNVLLPNSNKNILKIKKGEKWIHKNKDMILLDLIDSKYVMLDDHFNLIINGEKLSKFTKDIYTKFRDKYDDGDKCLISDIKGDCDLMILNNRDEI